MKLIKTALLALVILSANFSFAYFNINKISSCHFSEIPTKTICIKNPAAADINKFFSQITILNFEVFKVGSNEQLTKMVDQLRNNAAVESVVLGKLTGDYQSITITLKSAKNKTWFVNEFKSLGLNTIRVNNNPIVEVDKI